MHALRESWLPLLVGYRLYARKTVADRHLVVYVFTFRNYISRETTVRIFISSFSNHETMFVIIFRILSMLFSILYLYTQDLDACNRSSPLFFSLVLTLTKWFNSALNVIEINYHVSCFIFLMKLQAYTRLYVDYMLNSTLKPCIKTFS